MKYATNKTATVLALMAVLTTSAHSSIARESDAAIGELKFTGDTLVLPLKKHAMHPRLNVDFGDDVAHEFIVDTGASVNVIDTTIAEKLGFEVVGETEIGAPGGPQIPAKIVKVPLAQVGGATIVDAEFVTMDVLGFSGGTTHGVLGTGIFSDYLLTFDRKAGHIELSRGSLSANEPGVLSYDPSNSQVEIEMDVAGRTVAAHIDTGSMGKFMLPGEIMASLSLQESRMAGKARLVGGNRDIKHAQLNGSIQFAGFEFKNPQVAFMTPSPGAGNIGSGILADYVVSIDQKNHLIGFRKQAGAGVATNDNKPRRIGVGFRGAPGGTVLTVASVSPDSLADKAGLVAGDVLLKLNERPTEQYEMSELRTLFGSNEPLKFDVERDGEAKTVEIK